LVGLTLAPDADSQNLRKPHYQPAQPKAETEVIKPKAKPKAHGITGTATHYAYHEGQAAAGPALRKALGKGWRGTKVAVCLKAHCEEVVLTDSCWCPKGNRIIDLDKRDFAKYAPLGQGVIKGIRVTW
jgi:hypothetical protein